MQHINPNNPSHRDALAKQLGTSFARQLQDEYAAGQLDVNAFETRLYECFDAAEGIPDVLRMPYFRWDVRKATSPPWRKSGVLFAEPNRTLPF